MSAKIVIYMLFALICGSQMSLSIPLIGGFGCGLDIDSCDSDIGDRFGGCGCGCDCLRIIPNCQRIPIYPPIQLAQRRIPCCDFQRDFCCESRRDCCCQDFRRDCCCDQDIGFRRNAAGFIPNIISSLVSSVLPAPLAGIPLPSILNPCVD